MPNPRNIINFDEVDVKYRTFKIDNSTITYDATKAYGSAQAGVKLAVTLSPDGTVALAADGDAVIGRLEKVEADLKASVAVGGCLAFKGGNAAPLTRGKKIVGALDPGTNKGFVRDVNTAVAAELGKARGAIYDLADTNNVIVEL
jgi:hypothetical protein